MPRDLGDVLHYFLPQPEEVAEATDVGGEETRDLPPSTHAGGQEAYDVPPPPHEDGHEVRDVLPLGGELPPSLPTLALPVGERDVVRAALAWNLTVEIARLGGCATLVTRTGPGSAALWPEPGRGPVGAEVVHTTARGLGDLYRSALDVAVARSVDANDGGVVLVCVPPAWLRPPGDGGALLRWVLLLSTADRRELMETYALAKPLLRSDGHARVGVTIHGVRRMDEAEQAFVHLARVAAKHIGRPPVSYGLLVDDLHVYRAIVARRPIGLEHPQAPAARALRDVARLVLEDARKAAVA